MTEERFDAIVIGAGAGGLTVAMGLAGLGRTVAIIEAARVGGDCTNTGCIPSKRLIHLSRRDTTWFTSARNLADVRETRDGLSRRERAELEATPNLKLVEGVASLSSRSSVIVRSPYGERTLRAGHIVIATGSRPVVLDIAGLPPARRLTTEDLFDLDVAPAHLAIVGAGAIGVEMAGAFTRMGTRVTLIDTAERVLPMALPLASETVTRALVEQGVVVHLGSRVVSYDSEAQTLIVETPSGPTPVHDTERVLVAVGRASNVDGLNLPAAGLIADPAGIAVDSWGRTAARGVWAVGDVTHGSHQTHAANALGRRVVQRIAFPWLPPIGRPPMLPSAVFSDPEVAWVGPRRQELERRYGRRAIRRIHVGLEDLDRGLTDGVRHGFLSIDAMRGTGRVLSATFVGPFASEVIATLTLAVDRGISLLRLARVAWAYPTFSAAIGKAADEFSRSTLANLRAELTAYATHRIRRGDRENPR